MKREEGRRKSEEGRGKRDEGRGTREEGRGREMKKGRKRKGHNGEGEGIERQR